MTYYAVCKDVTNLKEMEKNLILPSFKKLKFANCNKKFWKKLMYKAFTSAKSKCDEWHDYEMNVEPYADDKPIRYEFTACPAAQFAKQFGLTEVMPALCNVDYDMAELNDTVFTREQTLAGGGSLCDCHYDHKPHN